MEVWIHIVFFVAISLVSDFMDLYCIGRQLWFKLVYLSMGMPTSGMIHIYCLMFACIFHPTFLFQFVDAHIFVQDTRYIKYAEQKRNARNNRITVKYPA
jgi:hypothetical protein